MMKKLLPLLAVAASAAFPLFADDEYAVTAATSSAQTFALYTSAAATPTYALTSGAAATPTYALTSGALSSPFNITYRDGETVSVTSPNGVTTALSGSGGTIEYVPASGGLWTFANSNGETALVGVDWSIHDDAPAPATDTANLVWLETVDEGPDRKITSNDRPSVAYSDATFAGTSTGAVTLTLTSPSGEETIYTKTAGENAKSVRLTKGVWTVVLTSSAGSSTAHITVTPGGIVLIVK